MPQKHSFRLKLDCMNYFSKDGTNLHVNRHASASVLMEWLCLYLRTNGTLNCFVTDKIIRHRACSLKDAAHAMIASELDPEFDRMCEEIKESRRKRGELPSYGTKIV